MCAPIRNQASTDSGERSMTSDPPRSARQSPSAVPDLASSRPSKKKGARQSSNSAKPPLVTSSTPGRWSGTTTFPGPTSISPSKKPLHCRAPSSLPWLPFWPRHHKRPPSSSPTKVGSSPSSSSPRTRGSTSTWLIDIFSLFENPSAVSSILFTTLSSKIRKDS